MLRWGMSAIALLTLSAADGPAQDATKLPTGPTPRLVVVGKLMPEQGLLTIREGKLVPVVFQEKRAVVVGGMQVEQLVTVTRFQTVIEEKSIIIKGSEFQTAGGETLKADEAAKRMTPGSIVLMTSDGKPIDAAYLRVFKSDTLVIIPPVK
jgi:hypothetical protein